MQIAWGDATCGNLGMGVSTSEMDHWTFTRRTVAPASGCSTRCGVTWPWSRNWTWKHGMMTIHLICIYCNCLHTCFKITEIFLRGLNPLFLLDKQAKAIFWVRNDLTSFRLAVSILQKFSYWKEYVVEKAEIRRRRNGGKRFVPRHHMLRQTSAVSHTGCVFHCRCSPTIWGRRATQLRFSS